jgi:hypothetical protein
MIPRPHGERDGMGAITPFHCLHCAFAITFGADTSLTVGPGWDNVTGLVSPTGCRLSRLSGVSTGTVSTEATVTLTAKEFRPHAKGGEHAECGRRLRAFIELATIRITLAHIASRRFQTTSPRGWNPRD